jgi:hypothetical protein
MVQKEHVFFFRRILDERIEIKIQMAADSICGADVGVRFDPGKVSSEKEDRDLQGKSGVLAI